MTHALIAFAAVTVAVPVTVLHVLFTSPGGLLPACVPRRWRWRWRKLRGEREGQRSARISPRLRARVMRADRRRCVFCGSHDLLQIDHIVPWSLGGLTCLWNCAVLCAQHNRMKSSWWRSPAGTVCYRPFRGHDDAGMAAEICATERAVRARPLRWLRAYGLLPGL